MKRWMVVLLALALLCGQFAMAAEAPDVSSYTDEELAAFLEALQAELAKRGEEAPAEEEEQQQEVLQQGSKGDAVKELQLRLIELNYLSGSADGDFGGKTKSAIELFQKTAGLEVTGVADAETQDAIFAEDAPVAKVYEDIDFKGMSRDPDKYEGKNYKFSGKVLQVLETAGDGFTYVAMRIATKGNYDNVVYVHYLRPDGESRILEDDRVTVHGASTGLYTYETVRGDAVTLPQFMAETVTIN